MTHRATANSGTPIASFAVPSAATAPCPVVVAVDSDDRTDQAVTPASTAASTDTAAATTTARTTTWRSAGARRGHPSADMATASPMPSTDDSPATWSRSERMSELTASPAATLGPRA